MLFYLSLSKIKKIFCSCLRCCRNNHYQYHKWILTKLNKYFTGLTREVLPDVVKFLGKQKSLQTLFNLCAIGVSLEGCLIFRCTGVHVFTKHGFFRPSNQLFPEILGFLGILLMLTAMESYLIKRNHATRGSVEHKRNEV